MAWWLDDNFTTGGISVKLTIKDIMLNKGVLFKLVQNKWDSPRKSYEVYKFYMELESQVKFFERERAKLAKTLGESVDGNRFKIKEENEHKYQFELDNLLNMSVELPKLMITIDDVANTQYTDDKESWYTPVEFYKLEKFFEKMNNPVDADT